MNAERERLLLRAKRLVSSGESAGVDYQSTLWGILNSEEYSELFLGLSEEERDALCEEISFGEEV